ncbi:prolyl oligopeptidase family serine peptidase [Thalassotalea sp. PS06]|uniref:prolyl oligopeptidase family serine peptidase n=1 Tax=Thalassotalea sp. PS06 TaxID=2594005 RepID=UPI00116261FF|nr:prolyl oligopeptidase family serine peptidase [Thalassotalea sp. PS06]QDP02814.1 prolyl oligopeptidase family serine peptidase [Thalassotalea sp. PS06]
MKNLSLIASALLLVACGSEPENTVQKETVEAATAITYPDTRKDDVVDEYFGTKVADPYRWLEDDRSEETAAWVKAENEVTFDYLDNIPYRDTLKKRLTELWNYEKYSAPFKEGEYTYFYKNDGLQNQYVVYRQKGDGEAEVFLDPNKFSEDGTTSLAQLSFSKDGSIAAYAISEGGSDWRKIIIIDAETKQQLEPALENIKFSGISWKGKEGFFYSSYDKPEGSELSAKTDQHKLYYHQIGTAQADDKVIFGATDEQKRRYVGAQVSEDDRFLLISGAQSTSGNDLHLLDLTKDDAQLQTIMADQGADTYMLDSKDDTLYLVTNLEAPNQKVVAMDVNNPEPANWKPVIAESENVLKASAGGGYLYAHYMVDATTKLMQFDRQGKKLRDIQLPDVGTASGLSGKPEDTVLYYSFTNYKTPGTIYSFDVNSGASDVYFASGAKFNSDDFVSKQVFYTSKDGTKVPMIITHKKGVELNGKNPTILYGYGGFNISLTPSFSVANGVWMEQGGVYAVANLRGGGEYGKDWHKAGTQQQKQNVFDDFIAAAEYLIDSKYTSSDHLAIRGGSNGGLLVGAVMLQRPELFKVALPAVGVLDMLRYHKFTSGAGWAYDYGTSDQSKEMFEYLYGYSPLHNVKEGVEYPATLITTGDHDDRVVPAHSFKFAAELQAKQAGDNPVLIRIETNAGHGAGTPVSKSIEQYADIFGFTLYNMDVKAL